MMQDSEILDFDKQEEKMCMAIANIREELKECRHELSALLTVYHILTRTRVAVPEKEEAAA